MVRWHVHEYVDVDDQNSFVNLWNIRRHNDDADDDRKEGKDDGDVDNSDSPSFANIADVSNLC